MLAPCAKRAESSVVILRNVELCGFIEQAWQQKLDPDRQIMG
jgi:hypothetical protein